METLDLANLAEAKLANALENNSGRDAITVYGGRNNRLRQTVIALREGGELAEHSSPGEATLQVLIGKINFRTRTESVELVAGEYMHIPDELHAVDALTDSVFLLTVSIRKSHED